jgi:uroporphyrinogen-III synthase
MLDSSGPGRLRVLVTRPRGQAERLSAGLEALGCTVHRQPLLELQPVPRLLPAQRQQLVDLDLYQHVIFVSANAVRFGMACIEDYWPQLPVAINWYAVGESTAAHLRDFGIEAITPGAQMTSEGLLALPALQRVTEQRILIIKGEGGRTILREGLERRGARVDDLACYRRCCPRLAPGELAAKFDRWRIQAMLISSGEGFTNLQALLSPEETTKFRDICLIVPSERVSRMAREAGYARVVTAENASDGAMLHTFEEWQARESSE